MPRNRLYRLRKTQLCGQTRIGAHILGNTIGNAVAGGISSDNDTSQQGQGGGSGGGISSASGLGAALGGSAGFAATSSPFGNSGLADTAPGLLPASAFLATQVSSPGDGAGLALVDPDALDAEIGAELTAQSAQMSAQVSQQFAAQDAATIDAMNAAFDASIGNIKAAFNPDGHDYVTVGGPVDATAQESLASDSQDRINVLVMAQNSALNNRGWFQTYRHGPTYCNFATTSIVNAYHSAGLMTDSAYYDYADKAWGPLNADQIAENLGSSRATWRPVSADEAQSLANNGQLVILTYDNPEGHGHVATVRPEDVPEDIVAGKNPTYPLLANVGVGQSHVEYRSVSVSMNKPVIYYTPVSVGN